MRISLFRLNTLVLLSGMAAAQGPEIIHYTFDNGTASNSAVPGVGDGTVVGGVSFVTGNSCTNASAGAAQSDSAAEIDAGWTVDLGMDSWTIGMHLDLTGGSNGFQYYFGSQSTGGMRCFSAGAAGVDGIMMRTLQDDVILPGGALASAPTHVAWVYDNTVPEVRGYVDGVNVITVPQSAPINLVGTAADFKVMTYTTNMLNGNVMDDFRIYRHAIDQAELDAWINCSGGGLGTTYCDPAVINSTGLPGILRATGSDVALDDDFTLTATQVPDGEFAMFVASRTQGLITNPSGSQGNLCVIGNMASFRAAGQVGQIAGGMYSVQLPLGNFPEPPTGNVTVMAGDTWYFQCWHRDTLTSIGLTTNFTDAVEVLFQ
ncbi:MAG: hypothetical protein ACI8QC_003208 [Planctomycetota bacterium]|jgi:hypothetical protein